jgi:hypothetical protein
MEDALRNCSMSSGFARNFRNSRPEKGVDQVKTLSSVADCGSGARSALVSILSALILVSASVMDWGVLKSPCSQDEGSLKKARAIR